MKNVQQEIIDRINQEVINGIEEKGLNWFRPWKDATGGFRPLNGQNRPYNGINHFILTRKAEKNGWVNVWLTFEEVSKRRGLVKKGEKSTEVTFWSISFFVIIDGKRVYYRNINEIPTSLKGQEEKSFLLRTYKVFSISQTNLPIPSKEDEERELEPAAKAENIFLKWSEVVPVKNVDRTKAYYSPIPDFINMPPKTNRTWKAVGDFYKVFFHEAVHSTGHKSRLDRIKVENYFGSESYAKEELVAEIGALYLEEISGIETKVDNIKNSTAYIQGWIKKIKEEPNFILSASSQSIKAIDLILN